MALKANGVTLKQERYEFGVQINDGIMIVPEGFKGAKRLAENDPELRIMLRAVYVTPWEEAL